MDSVAPFDQDEASGQSAGRVTMDTMVVGLAVTGLVMVVSTWIRYLATIPSRISR